MSESTSYNVETQKLFLEFMLQDADLFIRVSNIFNPHNFDKSLVKTAEFIKKHTADYTTLPDRIQIKAVTGVTLQELPDLEPAHSEWFLDEFEKFTRRQELERAILTCADKLEKGEYEPCEQIIKDAVQISLTKDLGTDYFIDPRARLNRIREHSSQISTGWQNLDYKLFGGMSRGELNIFCGGSGSGKSLFLQNLACNWVLAGLNGIFITLELSEDLCSMRIDSMLTGIASREIFKSIDDVELKVKMISKKAGKLHIKFFPPSSTVNDIRAYVKELQIKEGIKLDFMCVDYIDLLHPVTVKVDPSNLFIKDKFVSEELRFLGKELHVLNISASQLNRSSIEEVDFNQGMIAGGLSKIMTADNVFGIFTSRAMREQGRYQLQLLKTRSSSGVGAKIDLEFDVNSLRISGLTEEQEQQNSPNNTSNIIDRIKNRSEVKSLDLDAPLKAVVKADVQSSKLRSMLAELKNRSNS